MGVSSMARSFEAAMVSCTMLPLLAAVAAAKKIHCPVRLLDIVPSTEVCGGTSREVEGLNCSAASEGLQLVDDGLEYLSQLRAPLHVVPALGVYRGGKSLLMNRLMGLHTPYPGGFGVGHEQQTFTRGIDICAQEHEGLGTVVWMDTEGLFSSEDARSAYGPKIFALALLFSSAVLLNNVKVLNEQFFAFFSEQQSIARVLKQGLAKSGLPADALLPSNLTVFWILQQPIRFDSKGEATRAQLETFLSLPSDESRMRVRRDFSHTVHEVPIATHDARQWGRLDQLGDEELMPEYVNASLSLRALILGQLQGARPLQPAGIAAQLRMYVELVQTERFSGALAKEAFEESEIGTLCDRFGRTATALAGALPSVLLPGAFEDALQDLESQRNATAEAFHLGSDWSRRLERCLRGKEEELRQRNTKEVLMLWQAAARGVAEEGHCFFLGRLTMLLKDFATKYGQAFSHAVQAQAVDFASALQRTRLVECVRLRDFLLPLAPWLAWPVISIYLRDSVISGLVTLALHVIVLAGLYAVMQFLHQLPPYLDIDYPVLRAHPILLDLTMRAPPMVPWTTMVRTFACTGAARSLWKLLRCLLSMGRPAGQAHYVGQMLNIELKLNSLLKRSEAMVMQELVASVLTASEHLEHGDARLAARALLRVLCLAREATNDWTLRFAQGDLPKRARAVLQHFRLPPPAAKGEGLPVAFREHDLEGLVARSDWDGMLDRVVWLLEGLMAGDHTQRAMLQQTPSPPRRRLRARNGASPVPAQSPEILADTSTECGSEGYQASSVEETCIFELAETVPEPRTILEETRTECMEEAEEEEDDGAECDICSADEEQNDEVADEVGTGFMDSIPGRARILAGALATLGGCGAAAALLAAAAAAGLLPAPET